ncbi:MAG TPA: PTS fructose transporter subunit IIA [Methylophilaceae bacterium]|nr:PTS fructose transporter subunit IIA [Methylophilaceae bacterium]
MIGILIVAHGTLGESLIHCASHVMGCRPPQLLQLSVGMHDDPVSMLPQAQQMISELDQGQGVLILSDIYGATPCNIVGKLLKPGQVEGVAGVNLPMLVRVLTYRNGNLAPLVEKALSGGRDGVIHFTEEACKKS